MGTLTSMGRIRRFASPASLLLLLATSTLFGHSYFRYAGINIPLGFSCEISILSGKGIIRLSARSYVSGATERFQLWSVEAQQIRSHIALFDKDFYFKRGDVSTRDGRAIAMTVVCFPHWVLVTVFTILPLRWTWIALVRPRRRRRFGLCVACAYDLTGNTSGVCPECATKVEAHASR